MRDREEGAALVLGDALEADSDGSWRVRTEIAQYFADRASDGEVTVLRSGAAAVVPADVAAAGLRALGRELDPELLEQPRSETR